MPALVFQGKWAFSTQGGAAYLAAYTVRSSGPPQSFPAMNGGGAANANACTVYLTSDGTYRIQLPNQRWIGFNPELGNLTLVDDLTLAATLKLGGTPLGQQWQVTSGASSYAVGYFADVSPPVLTTNLTAGASESFVVNIITPSAAAIQSAGSCVGGDLTQVILDAASFSGVDFTRADFSGGSLLGTSFSNCTLTRAVFRDANATGVQVSGSVLDGCDMTQATLGAPAWGTPKSARGIILAKCRASGAQLGNTTSVVDMSQAVLAQADFTRAGLQKLNLNGASAAGATLSFADLTNATLDGADMSNVMARGATFKLASLRNIRGPNAVFASADLSNADLGQAQLGAKNYLFTIAASLAKDLSGNAYPTSQVIAAFSTGGVTLSPSAPITILAANARWEIDDPHGPYALNLASSGIEVFLASPNLMPATLRGCNCLGTKASGAQLSGADLRNVRWYGAAATLDHADLENACLSGCLLTGTDLTQAFLSGADFSGGVLAQVPFRGCVIGIGSSGRAFSLEGAQLQGCDFTAATLQGALLIDAAVSVAQGVPLFTLPSADAQLLTPTGIGQLAPAFSSAGYPLGSTPGVASVNSWSVDNSSDPTPTDPRQYLIRPASGQLRVYDGLTLTYYFAMPASYATFLSSQNPNPTLINEFVSQGYGLVNTATITSNQSWTITAGSDAPFGGPFAYQTFTAQLIDSALQIYGSTLLYLRDFPQFPGGVAFSATAALSGALSGSSVGPSGELVANVNTQGVAWLNPLRSLMSGTSLSLDRPTE